jgi:hypothetical protein
VTSTVRTSYPAVAKSGDLDRSYFVRVYVIPKSELAKFGSGLPPAKWFEEKEREQYRAGLISARPFLDVFDNRDRIEKAYRVRREGDQFTCDLVSENKGDPWVERAWVGVCCGLPALSLSAAVAFAGVWVARRSKRKMTDRSPHA